jgi:hypothetical protein
MRISNCSMPLRDSLQRLSASDVGTRELRRRDIEDAWLSREKGGPFAASDANRTGVDLTRVK